MSTIEEKARIEDPHGEAEAVDFVRRFAEMWADPTPERLNGLIHEDAEFVQPVEPVVRGHDQAHAFWRRLFSLMPDLHGEIISWGHRDGVVYIELRLSGTLGGRPFSWISLDRIHLEQGKVRQRVAYFRPAPADQGHPHPPGGAARFPPQQAAGLARVPWIYTARPAG